MTFPSYVAGTPHLLRHTLPPKMSPVLYCMYKLRQLFRAECGSSGARMDFNYVTSTVISTVRFVTNLCGTLVRVGSVGSFHCNNICMSARLMLV